MMQIEKEYRRLCKKLDMAALVHDVPNLLTCICCCGFGSMSTSRKRTQPAKVVFTQHLLYTAPASLTITQPPCFHFHTARTRCSLTPRPALPVPFCSVVQVRMLANAEDVIAAFKDNPILGPYV